MPRGTAVRRQCAHANADPRLRGAIPLLTVALTRATAVALLIVAISLAPPATGAHAASPASPQPTAPPAAATLIRGDGMALPSPPVALRLAPLVFAPGSSGPSRSLPGPLLLAVEAGALDANLADAATLPSGDGALIQNQAAVTLRNDGGGPLLALMLTVDPAVGATSSAAI
jgi:hypothetical protein